MLLLLLACRAAPPPQEDLRFLRGAVLSAAPLPGARALPDGRSLLEHPWTPGEPVELNGARHTAPLKAECVPLFSVALGDVSRLIAMGPSAQPHTALAFSPDGQRLALGTHVGEVLVLDAWTGEVLARRRLAETLVREVAWSADGATLYAAEQSPDATLHALSPADLSTRWGLGLADYIETSAPPPGEDLYGVYSLPGAYGLALLPDASLVVVGLHSWAGPDGERLNRSQVLRVSPEGEVLARWPDRAADATLRAPRVDAEGGRLAVVVDRTASGPPPTDLPVGGVQVLSLPGLEPLGAATAEPLTPWFSQAVIWDGLALDAAADRLYMGFSDGRVQLRRLSDLAAVATLDPGVPRSLGEVPVHATVSYGFFALENLYFLTNGTYIPWGAAAPELRPPGAHPGENTLHAVDAEGRVLWTWTGEQRVEGLSLGGDGRHALVGAGPRQSDRREDLFGGLVFDLGGPERSGAERLEAFCRTEGPVVFRHALSADGRVALVETPWLHADGGLRGAYRVTVLR